MRVLFPLASILLSCTAPLSAQQVHLMHFTPLPQPAEASLETTDQAVSGALSEEALTADFSSLHPAPLVPAVSEASTFIAIPAWMRTGVPQGRFAPAVVVGPPGNCSQPAYRPRRDIGLIAEQRRASLYPHIVAVACEHGLPVGLLDALIGQESRYHQYAVSHAGAMGLTQLMPGTARYLGVANPWDVRANLRGGARYLAEQLAAFGRVDLALAAYNAGPARVRRQWAVPRIRETQQYVAMVTTAWRSLEQFSFAALDATPFASQPRSPVRRTMVADYTSRKTDNPM